MKRIAPAAKQNPAARPRSGEAEPMEIGEGYALLDRTHLELDDLFLEHQEQIIARNFQQAADLLAVYADRLYLHMQQEEDWLLPVFAQRVPARSGSGSPPDRVYLAEHRKIRSLLDRIRIDFQALLRPHPAHVHVIALLERESLLKRVLEHHNERERLELYAELQQLTSAPECRQIVERCLQQWDRHTAAPALEQAAA